VQNNFANKLSGANYLNVTVHIWHNIKMKAFPAVTAHFIPPSIGNKNMKLSSALLTCRRFTESHKGKKLHLK